MPKKKDDTPASSKVAWVEALPEGGGAWGRGIVSTVASMEADLLPLIEQRNELDRAVKVRESILSDAVKRANKEAKGLFNDGQIAGAKQRVADARDGDDRGEGEGAAPDRGEGEGAAPGAKPDAAKSKGKSKGAAQPTA